MQSKVMKKDYIKDYLSDFLEDLLYFLFTPSLKNAKRVFRYFSLSYFKRYRLEREYWKDKNVRETHADDF